ncbi:MAG TPA: 50S ribosomal protein L21 [Myxococcota bacterium]|nr:50S ribosomal protein L21 [Myxococcota bacterium]HNZ03236.1 50S ribosomal protein L21 [Myxococcota bacterium]HOD06563.1 50S ribosomal protein L21 [Myxococcota bacterium]HPB50423.1 50S ribosomal protein L21 [Myxococcota bacterium]HQP95323.1 50S ribosomal protein L21 [Myxococcota bacterium]
MYAVIMTGGKQYRVNEGDTIDVERLAVDVGSEIEFDQVLLVGAEESIRVGKPYVAGARVTCKVLLEDRGPKVLAFKKRRRQNSKRIRGHRQEFTRLLVSGIKVG